MRLDDIQKRLRDGRRTLRGPAGHRRVEEGQATTRVALGADHGGYALKESLKGLFAELGVAVDDLGTHSTDPVDYPDVAVAVARRVASGEATFGVVIDAAGLGSCMVANKVAGVRAATCHDEASARNSREHNNANVMVLGSRIVHRGAARRLVRIWLRTPFAGGRHARRVDKINALDDGD